MELWLYDVPAPEQSRVDAHSRLRPMKTRLLPLPACKPLVSDEAVVSGYRCGDSSTVAAGKLRGVSRVKPAPGGAKTVRLMHTSDDFVPNDRAGRETPELGGLAMLISASVRFDFSR